MPSLPSLRLPKGRTIAIVAVLALAVGGFVVVSGGDDSGGGGSEQVVVPQPVQRRTLQDVLTIRGEITREKVGDLTMPTTGVVSQLIVEEGDRIEEGDAVLALNGRPAIAVDAESRFFRPLDVGAEGPDVLQLEQILDAAGYDVGTVDQFFTEATKSGLSRWQTDKAYPPAGTETEETVTVALQSNPVGYTVGPLSSAGVVIVPSEASSSARAAVTSAALRATGVLGGLLGDRGATAGTGTVGPPTLTVTASPPEIDEGQTGTFTITSVDLPPAVDTVVSFTVSGSATSGTDFNPLPGSVTLEAGETQVGIDLAAFEDDLLEVDETVTVTLLPAAAYGTTAPSAATMTIVNTGDPEITVTAVPEEIEEGQSASFLFTSDVPPLETTTVDFTVGGSATVDDDFVELAGDGSVEFAPGQTQVAVPLTTLLDDEIEADETVTVTLSPVFGDTAYTVGADNAATVTILAEDGRPALSIEAPSRIITEGGAAQFTISADRPINDDLEIGFALSGSAAFDVDYNDPGDEITLAGGQSEVTLSITTQNDVDVEPDETLTVTILRRDEYGLLAPISATVTIEDNDLPELAIRGGGRVREGGAVTFTVSADSPMPADTSVAFSVSGTATPGADYRPLTGTLVMPRGTTVARISVVTIDDDAVFQPGDMLVADWPARAGRVDVSAGDVLVEGQRIMEFTEDDFSIRFSVSPSDRNKLITDQAVVVSVDATDEEVDGKILELDDAATVGDGGSEQYEGTVEAFSDVTAVDGAAVGIDVILDESVDALVVPVAALLQDGDGTDIVRVVRDGQLVRVPVETGLTEGAFVEIVSGLEGDEQVVVEIRTDAGEDG